MSDLPQLQPPDVHNKKLESNVHPPDWQNPAPAGTYNIVVIGGGVSLMGDALFLDPVREAVARYLFPPLAGQCVVTGPQLGEEVVVHGAVALAAQGRR